MHHPQEGCGVLPQAGASAARTGLLQLPMRPVRVAGRRWTPSRRAARAPTVAAVSARLAELQELASAVQQGREELLSAPSPRDAAAGPAADLPPTPPTGAAASSAHIQELRAVLGRASGQLAAASAKGLQAVAGAGSRGMPLLLAGIERAGEQLAAASAKGLQAAASHAWDTVSPRHKEHEPAGQAQEQVVEAAAQAPALAHPPAAAPLPLMGVLAAAAGALAHLFKPASQASPRLSSTTVASGSVYQMAPPAANVQPSMQHSPSVHHRPAAPQPQHRSQQQQELAHPATPAPAAAAAAAAAGTAAVQLSPSVQRKRRQAELAAELEDLQRQMELLRAEEAAERQQAAYLRSVAGVEAQQQPSSPRAKVVEVEVLDEAGRPIPVLPSPASQLVSEPAAALLAAESQALMEDPSLLMPLPETTVSGPQVWVFSRAMSVMTGVLVMYTVASSTKPNGGSSMPRGRAEAASSSPRRPNPPSGPSGRIELSALRRVAPSPQPRGRFEAGSLQKRAGQASPASSASAAGSEQLGGKLDKVKQRLLNIESRLASIEERLGDM